jgi:hypothetical protein
LETATCSIPLASGSASGLVAAVKHVRNVVDVIGVLGA